MTQLAPGVTLSHYRIVETLGQGGQATAFKAEDLRLARPVVIKVLNPELTASEAARRRFEREAALCSVLDNPHIAQFAATAGHAPDVRGKGARAQAVVLGDRARACGRTALKAPTPGRRQTIPPPMLATAGRRSATFAR